MTDAELVALLTEKSPRDLTAAEIDALRERWPQSADVRQALLDHLELEAGLLACLSDATLTVDQLLNRIERRSAERPRWIGRWGWLASSLLIAVLGAWWFRLGIPRKADVVERSASAGAQTNDVQPAQAETTPPSVSSNSAPPPMTAAMPATTIVAPAETPAVPADPWSSWLLPGVRPMEHDSSVLLGDLKSLGHDELPLDEFRRWWRDVPGQPLQWNQSLVGKCRTVQFNGTARLRAPWVADTWLRLTPFDVQELTLYFWTGEAGVALQCYRSREPHLWAAFAVERLPGGAQPSRWDLLATDSGAVYRSGVATLELHHHAGMLVLSVAQTPVLTAPLAQPPAEVVLQGQLRLRGASWLRAEPLPRTEPVPHAIVWSSAESATAWPGIAQGPATVEPQGDQLLLRVEASEKLSTSTVTLPQPGLYEIVTQIGSGDPGTGVFLGDANGKPLALLSLLRERRTGRLTFGALRPDERRFDSDYDARALPPPYLAEHQWLRLTAGWGALRIAVSGDGVHWGEVVESPLRDIRGAVQSVGLFALPGDQPRSLTVRRLDVRRLDAFTSIADADLLPAITVEPQTLPRDLARWELQALSRRPADVATALWLDTFAVATLQAGPSPELVTALVERLAASAALRDWTPNQLWSCYADALQVSDHWPERDAAAWARRYAQSAAREGATGRDAWAAWLRAPVWTHGAGRDDFLRQLAEEVLDQTAQRNWQAAGLASRLGLHLAATAHPDQASRDAARILEQIARWSRGISGETDIGRRDAADEVFPASWRHPFVPQLDKDAYNTRAELQAALDGGAHRDAARIALSLGAATPSGLLPDVREPNLFVSLPVALAGAHREHPAFSETMREEFSELGLRRMRQAAERADADAVRMLTLQFFGTPAAAAAHAWLADRELALGRFASAWRGYERALASATAEQQSQIEPRRTLARALRGPLPNEASDGAGDQTGNLRFLIGATRDVADLGATIDQLRPEPPELSRNLLALPPPLPPQRYRLEPRARFDGQGGHDAGKSEFRESDAFGRQFAVVADARNLYLSNRFQVTAYDPLQLRLKWAVAVGSEQGAAHGHRFTSMAPLAVNDALYVRRLTKAGIELACLDASNGNVRWHSRPADRGQWLSDPVWTADGLWALAAHKLEDEWLDLRWSRVAPASGAVERETSLFRLRDAWQFEPPCQVAVRGWSVVASIGGAVACFGLDGELNWVRQGLWLPPKIDPLAEDYLLPAPAISERDAIVSEPAARTVRCLDLASGQTRWSFAAPMLQGVAGVTERHVIIAERGGLSACDRATGALQWRRAIEGRLTAIAATDDLVTFARELPATRNRGWLQLVWLAADTGEPLAEMPVDADPREEWRFGPWFAYEGQSIVLVGQSWRDPHRDLAVLQSLGGSFGPWSDERLGPWQPAIENDERRAAQAVLPGWLPLCNVKAALSLASGEVRGRTPVLVSRLKKDDELRFVRHVAIPEQGTTTLHLRVGHQPGQSWRLQVRVDDRMLLDQVVDESAATNGWSEQQIPLGPSAGRVVFVQVAQCCHADKSAEGLWQTIDVRTQ